MLTWLWANKLPLAQMHAPADMAAQALADMLAEFEPDTPITIVDFCSGSGGPVPSIAARLNAERAQQGRVPANFVLSDLYPHIEDWVPLTRRSADITFISQPVDAAHPILHEALPKAAPNGKVIYLYSLCFHHFDDPAAHAILVNALEHADGIAILELQERRLSSLLLMPLMIPTVFLIVSFCFWRRPSFILLSPLLAATMAFDGFVSALRTRTPDEVKGMALDAVGTSIRQQWSFRCRREVHTLLLGYFTCFAGIRSRL